MKTIEQLAMTHGCGLALLEMNRCCVLHQDWSLSAFDLLAGLRELGLSDADAGDVIASIAAGGEFASAQVSYLASCVQMQRRLDVERTRGLPQTLLEPLLQQFRAMVRNFPGLGE